MNVMPMEWHNRLGRERRAPAHAAGWLCAAALAALPIALPRTAAADPPAAPPAAAEQPVDPAAKQLTAANGLFQRGLFKLAADSYQAFLQQYPQDPNAVSARYALGMCDYRLNIFDQAVQQLQPVLADPKFDQKDQALAVIGFCQLSLKQYAPAQASFDQLLQQYPQSKLAESAGLYRIQTAYLANQPKSAVDAADAFSQRFPQSAQRPAALYFKALAERSLSQNDQVVLTLAELIKNYPDSTYLTDSLLLSGQAHEAQNQTDPAIADYQQMLATASPLRKSEAGYCLGLAEYKAGKYPEAAAALAPVAGETPPGPYAKPAALQMGLAELAAGKTPDARTALTAVAANDPERAADARYGIAQCDIADKHYDVAEKSLDALAQTQPAPANLAQILLDRAVCLMELNQFDVAQKPLTDLAADHPTPPQVAEATYRQAFCLHKLGKFDQSHAACGQVAALPASDYTRPARELDAENLFQLGKYPEAEAAFTALKTDAQPPAQAPLTLRIGQCEYFAGHYDKAADDLAPLAADPKTPADATLRPALFLYGDALLQIGKNPDAAAALSKFITASAPADDTLEAQFKLALAQLRNKDTDPARQTLLKLTTGPDASPWVQRGLFEVGQLDYKSAQPDPAAAALNRLLNDHPTPDLSAPALYLLAWIDFDAKRYPDAADKWKQVADKYPTDKLADDAAYEQGVALHEAGKNPEALAALQAYADAHPTSPNAPKARQLAAACLTAMGKDADAAKLLATVAADPNASDTALYDLAWAQRSSKDEPGAIATYQRLLKDHPDSKLADSVRSELAELLYDQKQYQQAATLLEAVTANPGTPAAPIDPKLMQSAHYRLGWCYEKLGQSDKAAAQFATFTDVPPGTPPGNDDLAGSALLQGAFADCDTSHFDKAEDLLTQMLKKYPQHAQASVAMLKLGEVQNEEQKFDASGQTFTTFLGQYPKDPLAYRAQFGMGWSLENRKQYQPARDAYKLVIAADNGETAARAQFQIGETFLAEQKFEQAIPALLAVEDVYAYPKWSARALYEAGRAFEQLNEPEQARKQYSTLLSKYKDAPEATMAQDRLKEIHNG